MPGGYMFGGVKPVRRLYVETRPAACHLTTWNLLTKVGGRSWFFSSRYPVCSTSQSACLLQTDSPAALPFSTRLRSLSRSIPHLFVAVRCLSTYNRDRAALRQAERHHVRSLDSYRIDRTHYNRAAQRDQKPSSKKDARTVPPVESECHKCNVWAPPC